MPAFYPNATGYNAKNAKVLAPTPGIVVYATEGDRWRRRVVEEGTQDPPASLAESYQKLVEDLSAERRDDSYLQDESWDWIFDGQEPGNLIKVYGRLAWVNLQLLEMM